MLKVDPGGLGVSAFLVKYLALRLLLCMRCRSELEAFLLRGIILFAKGRRRAHQLRSQRSFVTNVAPIRRRKIIGEENRA